MVTMPHQLSFHTEYTYRTGDVGILVPVRLNLGDQFIDFDARVDTARASASSIGDTPKLWELTSKPGSQSKSARRPFYRWKIIV
jgi:hypothetical protein